MRFIILSVLILLYLPLVCYAGETEDIKAYCSSKWEDNYRMVEDCYEKQMQALERVYDYIEKHELGKEENQIEANPYYTIYIRCYRKWNQPEFDTCDYQMAEHCIKRQLESYKRMKSD